MTPDLIPPFSIPHLPLTLGGLATFVVCWLIITSGAWHGRYTHDHTDGVQKFHQLPTPRIGGLAIMLGMLVGWWLAPPLVDEVLLTIWLASMPAFVFGFTEDLTRRVGVRTRLLATMASGVLAWWLTGHTLNRVDVPGFDSLLMWLPLSIAFTAFAVAGIANAINIIDGFNGLASGAVLIALGSLGYTAYLAGDAVLAKTCFVLGGITLGFFLVNYPMGKIFLGDGGAYVLGFWLGWMAVLLVARNAHVTAWSALLACAYPLTEVLFSMYRRWKRGLSPGAPDRLHLHSLIKIRWVRKRLAHRSSNGQNASVGPYVWLLYALPAFIAPALMHSTALSFMAFVVFMCLYAFIYNRFITFKN